MLLKFGATCRSRGERLGTLWGVTLEPSERLLLRVVVEEPQAEPLVRRKVPFGRIVAADADQVVLSMSPAEFAEAQAHEAQGSERPQRGRRRRGDEPPERLITAASRVACRDGEVGRVAALAVDSRSGDVEDVSFAFGTPLSREIVVPGSEIEDIRDDRISLRIPMDALDGFPPRRI